MQLFSFGMGVLSLACIEFVLALLVYFCRSFVMAKAIQYGTQRMVKNLQKQRKRAAQMQPAVKTALLDKSHTDFAVKQALRTGELSDSILKLRERLRNK